MSKWTLDKKLDQPRAGLLLQQLTTYEQRDGVVYRTIVTRTYYGDDDYQDSQDVTPIGTKQ